MGVGRRLSISLKTDEVFAGWTQLNAVPCVIGVTNTPEVTHCPIQSDSLSAWRKADLCGLCTVC